MSPGGRSTCSPSRDSAESSEVSFESDGDQIHNEEGEEEAFGPSDGDTEISVRSATSDKERQRQLYSSGIGSYNALKTFNGKIYSGMTIGSSHSWNYDQGLWKETKIEPDLWTIDYKATKRRARKAPKGSGAPVGAQYHWYIVAHQVRTVNFTTLKIPPI